MFKPVDPLIKFPEMEKKWLTKWEKEGTIQKYLHKNSTSSKTFSFLDGPITANNPMGVHHAWGRTYKDLWQKFHNLLGHRQRFQNGFDCQGLWVEVEVEKELGFKTKKDIENLVPGDSKASIAKFVELCKKRVLKYAGIQTEQSKRLGYFMDWDHSYFTMSEENNYMIWHFLKTCFDYGWIYKGRESVPWCPRCETAISEHEILTEDYKLITHKSIYFLLPLVGKKNEYLLVWTTTPWTLPANIAVAVDPKLEYVLVAGEKGNYWLAKESVKRVLKTEVYKILRTVKGSELVGLKYEGGFDELPAVRKVAKAHSEKFHTVIATDPRIMPITVTEGTGMVHTAVSAGTEDFKLGKKLGLPMIPVIGDNADYLSDLGFLTGKNAKKHPELILDYLLEKDKKGVKKWVYEVENYAHRYPGCWRCKTELVWKVEDEWYIAMDKKSKPEGGRLKVENKTLRERMIAVAKKIKWMPQFGLDRELDWLKNMHDWLISKKNRYWGLALPIYECKKCGHFEVFGSKEELKKRASAGWEKFDGHSPHKPFIDEVKIRCNKCNSEVSRTNDVGNPWLDAGIVGFSTITKNNKGIPLYLSDKKEWEKWFPADFITESFPGQFKNWFYSLIAMSTVLENRSQFKTVLGFGTMLDEAGKPFHKSVGNAIEFVEGADRFGADIIRWVCCTENPANNVLFGEHKTQDVMRQFYLILWNTYKFFVEYANLDKWRPSVIVIRQPAKKQSRQDRHVAIVPRDDKNILDRWILSRFNGLIGKVKRYLIDYNARDATAEIENFVSDLSTWYIRRSRDRVWLNSDNQKDKQSFYQTSHSVLSNLMILLSPVMPFISEELFTNLAGENSVHLAEWPKVDKQLMDPALEHQMLLARKMVELGHAKRKSLAVKVRIPLSRMEIETTDDVSQITDAVWEVILRELNVKNVRVNKKYQYPKKEVHISEEELRMEGEVRNLLRQIQSERKALGLSPTDRIDLTIPESFEKFLPYFSKRVMNRKIQIGSKLSIKI